MKTLFEFDISALINAVRSMTPQRSPHQSRHGDIKPFVPALSVCCAPERSRAHAFSSLYACFLSVEIIPCGCKRSVSLSAHGYTRALYPSGVEGPTTFCALKAQRFDPECSPPTFLFVPSPACTDPSAVRIAPLICGERGVWFLLFPCIILFRRI